MLRDQPQRFAPKFEYNQVLNQEALCLYKLELEV